MYCFVSIVFYVLFVCKCVLLRPGVNQSYHIISYHIISYHIISYHIISYHIISYHIVSYRIYRIVSYHIISYRIVSYRIISYIIYHISYRISYHIRMSITLNLPYSSISISRSNTMEINTNVCSITLTGGNQSINTYRSYSVRTCERTPSPLKKSAA